jgi:ATPase subunit of ABC transporter with duplicated ATPase domains
VWLEEYLATYPKILVVISHSQDFLNGVTTHTMVMQEGKLRYWTGNYDQYVATRAEQEPNQVKLFKKQEKEITEIKEFIASCGTYANLVRQAKSKQKILDKMYEAGLTPPVARAHSPRGLRAPEAHPRRGRSAASTSPSPTATSCRRPSSPSSRSRSRTAARKRTTCMRT